MAEHPKMDFSKGIAWKRQRYQLCLRNMPHEKFLAKSSYKEKVSNAYIKRLIKKITLGARQRKREKLRHIDI